MPVSRTQICTLDGAPVEEFTLCSRELEVKILTIGASITSFKLLARDLDVCPGYPTHEGYLSNPFKLGCTVGRVVNRIANAKFKIDGEEFQVSKNFNNKHCIHGGERGFNLYNWSVEGVGEGWVRLGMVSPDGDQGFPGQVAVAATYTLQGNDLSISYRATTTKPTPINVTSHCYFNLAGHNKSRAHLLDHVVQIMADDYLLVDEDYIPLAKQSVKDTIYDLRKPTRLGDVITSVPGNLGYDNCLCLDQSDDGVKAVLSHGDVTLHVFTNQPAFQFYNGYWTNVPIGKEGAYYQSQTALALEAQGYPDAVNHPAFPSTVIRPGETYQHDTVYRLSCH